MNGGAFILMISPKTQRLLLGLRGDDASWNPNTWFSFGGTMEEGETPRDTAVREFFEETKLDESTYKLDDDILFHKTTDVDGVTHNLFIFLATMDQEMFPEIDFESKNWRWMKISDLPYVKIHPGLRYVFSDPTCISRIKKALMSVF